MRINQSDINISLYQRSGQQTNSSSLEQTTESTTELEDNQRQWGESVRVQQQLKEEYYSQLYSRLSSESLIRHQEDQTQTSISYESMVMAFAQGLIEQDLQLGALTFVDDNNGTDQVARILDNQLMLDGGEINGVTEEASQVLPTEVSGTQIRIEQQASYSEESYSLMVSTGKVELADGRTIDFRLELERGYQYSETSSLSVEAQVQPLIDPLVINLDGNPESLSSGVFSFDIDADGEEDNIAQLSSGSGFLALDINSDGQINDGTELFGAQSGDGFGDLALFDLDQNGWIDEADEVFNQLKIWQPNEQGEAQLLSLAEAGVGAIYLGSARDGSDIKGAENQLLGRTQQQGLYLKESGEVGSIQQIDFAKQDAAPESNLQERFDALAHQLEGFLSENQGRLGEGESITLIPGSMMAINANPANANSNNASNNRLVNPFTGTAVLARLNMSQSQVSLNFSRRLETVTSMPDKPEQLTITPPKAAYDSQSVNTHEFRVFADDSSLTSKEQNTKQIIDEILRPMMKELQEQLQEKRKQASMIYKNNAQDFQ